MRVLVESVIELTQVQKKKIESLLKKKYDEEIKLKTKINPQVLGGVRLTFGSTRIDLSLEGKLEQIKSRVL